MDRLKNFAEIEFVNPILIDIFGHYADNSAMAEFVQEDGTIRLKFKVEPPVEPPKNCEQVLSLMYALFESNPDSTIGRVYSENLREILRETIYRLSQVLDGFSDIRLRINTVSPETGAHSHTEFTLTKDHSNG